ncbi:MAG: MauE/DoxX family redox-associated membrane protein [Bacteroidota bacterium]
MQKNYTIHGMTCNGCVARVKTALEALPEIENANIDLASKQAVLSLNAPISTEKMQENIGHYQIQAQVQTVPSPPVAASDLDSSLSTYKPLILIVLFTAGTTLLAQYPFQNFSGMLWMRHFMAGFFIVFSFFKLLNLEGFANSYQMYDIVAARWRTWGFIYPFVELGLGILYLTNLAPTFTNWATIIVLGVSSIGVIQSNLNKRKIKCACLGDVFNLPMSTVTVVEDLTMVGMAVGMLVL